MAGPPRWSAIWELLGGQPSLTVALARTMVEDACIPQRPVRLTLRFWSLFGAWAAALIAAACGLERGPEVAQMAPLFPLPTGMFLCAPLVRHYRGDSDFYVASAVGWLFYALLSAAVLWAGKRRRYLLLYSALCVLLALNVVGCHELQHFSFKQ